MKTIPPEALAFINHLLHRIEEAEQFSSVKEMEALFLWSDLWQIADWLEGLRQDAQLGILEDRLKDPETRVEVCAEIGAIEDQVRFRLKKISSAPAGESSENPDAGASENQSSNQGSQP